MTEAASEGHAGLDAAADWLHQRRAFNHDWLKNRFLIDLGGWLNVLDDAARTPQARDELRQAYAELRHGALRDWAVHRDAAVRLVSSVEDALSPAHQMKRSSLRLREAERRWLAAVVHELWKARHAIDDVREAALTCIASIDQASERLLATLACSETEGAKVEPTPHAALALLYDACYTLATLIERFPRAPAKI